jgi:catechol 2,3-dioxygenase-like lactoylglutathione lyase family enzyme
VTRITHVGICVRNLARSRDFYCGVFGLDPVADSFRMGRELDHFVLVSDCDYEMQFYRKGDFLLELFQPHSPGALGGGCQRPNNTAGDVHLTIEVDDMDEALARIEELGGSVLHETRTTSSKLGIGDDGELAFAFDPDGVRIELVTKLMDLK